MTTKTKTKTLINTATTNDRNPPSGYLLKELAARTLSISECQMIEDLVMKKLSKSKPYVKYKALRIIQFLCHNGSPNWRRAWQRNTDKLRDAQQFRGPPDPIYGDAPYQQVRRAAKQAMQAVFQQSQIDSSHIKNRIKTFQQIHSSQIGTSTFDSNTRFSPLYSKRKKGAVGGVWDNDNDDEEDEDDYVAKRKKQIISTSGLFEKQWVENIVKSGGVGIKVMDLPKWVQQFENLWKIRVLEYLNDTLEEEIWQKQGKALTLINALIKGKSGHDVIDYFTQTPDNIQSLVVHQKSILRKAANAIIEYLDIEHDNASSSVSTIPRKQKQDDNIFKNRFDELIAQREYLQAAKLAADTAPHSVLRTAETIQLFKAAPNIGGGAPMDLQYYTFLLQKGALNKVESICLCQRILQFKPNEGKSKIEKLLKEQKFEKSQELGNILVRHDAKWGEMVGTKYDLINKHSKMEDPLARFVGSDDPFSGLVVGNNDNNNNNNVVVMSNPKKTSTENFKELSKHRNSIKEYENKLQEMEKNKIDLELKWNESKQTKENDNKIIFQLTNELNEYRKQNQMQLNKIKSLTIENDKLRVGMKEKDMALNEMKQKLKRIKFKINNYMEWGCDDVVEWIINIDKSFIKYKHILTMNIRQEKISGANLPDIDKNDLHRFGIQEFSHKTLILQSIQNLVQQNQRNNNNIIAFQGNADAEGLQIVDTMQ